MRPRREPLRLDVRCAEGAGARDEDAVLTALARYLVACWREGALTIDAAPGADPMNVDDQAEGVAA